jgi:hypothetical protein
MPTSAYVLPDGEVDDTSPVQNAAQDTGNIVDNPKPVTLAFVEGDTPQYAVVPFPETYQAAVVAAIAVLGSYMSDPRPENIVLKCSAKSREGVWIWANIEPKNWKLVLGHYGDDVGVFEKRRDMGFLHGEVDLAIKTFTEHRTQWKHVTGSYDIDRPKNFQDAVDIVKSLTCEHFWQPECFKELQKFDSPDAKCTFYRFFGEKDVRFVGEKDVRSWVAFPPAAYTDDHIWRSIVPPPGQTLGLQIST